MSTVGSAYGCQYFVKNYSKKLLFYEKEGKKKTKKQKVAC